MAYRKKNFRRGRAGRKGPFRKNKKRGKRVKGYRVSRGGIRL